MPFKLTIGAVNVTAKHARANQRHREGSFHLFFLGVVRKGSDRSGFFSPERGITPHPGWENVTIPYESV